MHCRCGREGRAGARHVRDLLHARRHDEEHFGVLTEAVLERDAIAAGVLAKISKTPLTSVASVLSKEP